MDAEVKQRIEATWLKIDNAQRHTQSDNWRDQMQDLYCCVPNCQARAYAPAGTRSVCKDHFLSFLTWRRRRGPQMFHTYAGMTMGERDGIAAEWLKTIRIDEVPTTAPKL